MLQIGEIEVKNPLFENVNDLVNISGNSDELIDSNVFHQNNQNQTKNDTNCVLEKTNIL